MTKNPPGDPLYPTKPAHGVRISLREAHLIALEILMETERRLLAERAAESKFLLSFGDEE